MNDWLDGLRLMDGFEAIAQAGDERPGPPLTGLTEAEGPLTRAAGGVRNTHPLNAETDAWYCRPW